MTAQQLEAALTQELRRIAPDIDVTGIDRNRDLREEFDIDSMDFLNLVTALNKRFGIPIPEGDYPKLTSFSGIVAYLAEKTE
jgi:acyl carrier protein